MEKQPQSFFYKETPKGRVDLGERSQEASQFLAKMPQPRVEQPTK